MEYTPPSYDSVVFCFVASGYTPPSYNAVTFNFVEEVEGITAYIPGFESSLLNVDSIVVSLPAFEASGIEKGAAFISTSVPSFTSSLSDEQQIDTSVPAFTASLTGPAVAEVTVPAFQADLTGNAISNVDIPAFTDGGVLLRENEVWNEPEVPAFTTFTSASAYCAVSPIKITVPAANISEDLWNFPIRISLSESCSSSDFDASVFFFTLVSAENRYKISVTTDDMSTQCYVEIDPNYDFENMSMDIWVKAPHLSSTTDTELYLYYDSGMDDNTTYVGDTGSAAARAVWDSAYKGVWHLGQSPVGTILDSTENENDGSPFDLTADDLVDGVVGKAVDIDADGGINCGTDSSLDITGDITVEAVVNPGTIQNYQRVVAKSGASYGQYQFNIRTALSGSVEAYETLITTSESGSSTVSSGILAGPATGFRYIASTIDVSEKLLKIIVNDDSLSDTYTGIKSTTTAPFTIGYRAFSGDDYGGTIDEVRVSNVVRSDAWIAASQLSYKDELVSLECLYTPESWAENPVIVFHASDVPNVNIPAFTADGTTNAVLSTNLPSFRAEIGFAGEIEAELPYFTTSCVSVSEILASAAVSLPAFNSDLYALVDGMATCEPVLPHFTTLLTSTTVIPSTIAVELPGFQVSIESGQDITGEISATVPAFSSHLMATHDKAFYQLRYRDRYWE